MSYFNYVKCPYCGEEHNMNETELDRNEVDIECEVCGKAFEVIIELNPIYSVNEINYNKCKSCGIETKDIRIDAYKKEELCRNCYFKRYIKRLKQK